MTLRLLFARHGESEWQAVGDEAGSDSRLTQLGRQQADRLGRWLVDHIAVDYIYASPLRRARETAQRVAVQLELPVTVQEDLKEAWFFVAPHLPTFANPSAVLNDVRMPTKGSGETYWAFRTQVRRAVRDILSRHRDGALLVVAHGGTISTALRLLLGSDAFTVNVGNTTLHSLTWTDGRWHVEYVDRWEHLRDLDRTY